MTRPKFKKSDITLARHEVIQPFLDLKEKASYLEIGVAKGETFHEIKAYRKVGVDPAFQFDISQYTSPEVALFNMTSDKFFAKAAMVNKYDVIYIDGLHTAEQTLRDLINAQTYLASDGVIIVDDVWPNSFVAAVKSLDMNRAIRQSLHIEDPAWMGDVFKLLYFIEVFMQPFTYHIVKENYGQAVLWRQVREQTRDITLNELSTKCFSDLLTDGWFYATEFQSILRDYTKHTLLA